MENRNNDGSPVDVESGERLRPAAWPTVDGPLGVSWEEAEGYARRFFLGGSLSCPSSGPSTASTSGLSSSPNPRRRPLPSFLPQDPTLYDVVRSSIGFSIFAVVLTGWALTFAIGGERLFGPIWKDLVMYNLADRLQLTGWM